MLCFLGSAIILHRPGDLASINSFTACGKMFAEAKPSDIGNHDCQQRALLSNAKTFDSVRLTTCFMQVVNHFRQTIKEQMPCVLVGCAEGRGSTAMIQPFR